MIRSPDRGDSVPRRLIADSLQPAALRKRVAGAHKLAAMRYD
jgi:hypothetical protein